jgi:hypothetical protein
MTGVRNWPAVDPNIPEFYRPERGGKILSPKAARCVYWDIASEVTDEADAVSVMRALYPTHPTNPYAQFFEGQTCKIVAYLLTYSDPRPSCCRLRLLAGVARGDLPTSSWQ